MALTLNFQIPDTWRRRAAGLLLVTLALSGCQSGLLGPESSNGTKDETGNGDEVTDGTITGTDVSNRYLILFQPGVDAPGKAGELTKTYGGTVHFTYDAVFKGFAATLPANAVGPIKNNASVRVLVPDAVVSMDATQTLGNAGLWGLDRIDQRLVSRKAPLNNSYVYETTAPDVEVYIVDSGVLLNHLEFGSRAQLFNDYVLDGRTGDCNGHGTFVAGIAAGSTAGVAKGAKVRSARVLGCDGTGTLSAVIAAINDITNRKIANPSIPMVGNLSLGGENSALLDEAIDNSVARGVTWTVSAGNNSTNACNASPASALSALTVAASTNADAQAPFSNFGTCVDLYAPGNGIYSATGSGTSNYATRSGTSAAAAFVAGAAAIYLQTHPSASAYEVSTAITSLATANAVTSVGVGTPNRLLYSVIAGLSVVGPSSTSFPVQVGIGGNGGTGTVTGNGISCSSAGGSTNDCEQYFTAGTSVTLTATPGANSGVTWGGACDGANGTSCTVSVDGTTSVIVDFNVAQLTVIKSGTGTGTITSNPTGISCGTACSAAFALGSTVTLTATAATGSQFVRWSGAPCDGSTSPTCAVTMATYGDQSVTAVFQGLTTLTVAKSGTGTGTVTSTPAGIACGADCTEQVLGGTAVTLSATPDANNRFDGWSGACTGTNATCTVTMDGAKTATAIFTSTIPYDLNVTLSGNGDGQVTSSPAGIACVLTSGQFSPTNSDCVETYLNKQLVTLTAAPTKSSSLFTGWTGACSGTQNSCTVTMDAAKTVSAAFNTIPGIHTADLETYKVYLSRSWELSLTIAVHGKAAGGDHTPVDLAVVSVNASGAASGTFTCTTDSTGSCVVKFTGLSNRSTTLTVTVANITKTGYKYDPTGNHDTVGGITGDGTTLTIIR